MTESKVTYAQAISGVPSSVPLDLEISPDVAKYNETLRPVRRTERTNTSENRSLAQKLLGINYNFIHVHDEGSGNLIFVDRNVTYEEQIPDFKGIIIDTKEKKIVSNGFSPLHVAVMDGDKIPQEKSIGVEVKYFQYIDGLEIYVFRHGKEVVITTNKKVDGRRSDLAPGSVNVGKALEEAGVDFDKIIPAGDNYVHAFQLCHVARSRTSKVIFAKPFVIYLGSRKTRAVNGEKQMFDAMKLTEKVELKTEYSAWGEGGVWKPEQLSREEAMLWLETGVISRFPLNLAEYYLRSDEKQFLPGESLYVEQMISAGASGMAVAAPRYIIQSAGHHKRNALITELTDKQNFTNIFDIPEDNIFIPKKVINTESLRTESKNQPLLTWPTWLTGSSDITPTNEYIALATMLMAASPMRHQGIFDLYEKYVKARSRVITLVTRDFSIKKNLPTLKYPTSSAPINKSLDALEKMSRMKPSVDRAGALFDEIDAVRRMQIVTLLTDGLASTAGRVTIP